MKGLRLQSPQEITLRELRYSPYLEPLGFPLSNIMSSTPTRNRVNPENLNVRPLRRPEWIKVRAPSGETYERLQTLMRSKELHTVCEEAMCPNMGECWGSGTATFLMLGDVCTRTCGFCDIKHGMPALMDWGEAERVAQAVKSMNLKHAVITSVNRDDRRDGGAPIFAMVIRRIREVLPGCSIEVLIPDFKGSLEALKIVMEGAARDLESQCGDGATFIQTSPTAG